MDLFSHLHYAGCKVEGHIIHFKYFDLYIQFTFVIKAKNTVTIPESKQHGSADLY